MAGFRTAIEVQGIEPAQRALRRIGNLGNDIGEPLGIIGDYIEGVVVGRFRSESGPGGIPWPKSKRALGLAPNARGQKVPGKTLSDTGDLRNSLDVEKRAREVEIGFRGLRNPAKAPANQFGSHGPTFVTTFARTVKSAFGIPLPEPVREIVSAHGRITNLPARPMLGLDSDMVAGVEDIAHNFLLDLLHD